MSKFYDATKVKAEISHQIERIISNFYPQAKKEGSEYRVGNLDGDKGRSLRISTRPDKFGQWYDHSSGQGGDIITLTEIREALTYGEAIVYLAEKYTNLSPETEYQFDGAKRENKKINPEEWVTKLSDKAIEYAENVRKISRDTLFNYKVLSSKQNPDKEICFVSTDPKGNPVKAHFSGFPEKSFRSNPNPGHSLWGTYACKPGDSGGILTITEGQWDAMSYKEVGVNAVSVPSGSKNLQWIEEDFRYLQQFHTFIISFDMDEAGQEQIDEIAKRLGINNCKIVKLPEKDANDMIQKGRGDELLKAWKEAEQISPNEIASVSQIAEEAWNVVSQDLTKIGIPCFLPNFQYRVRHHEITIVFGETGHGKSEWTQNQIAFMAHLSEMTMIGSFEQKTSFTLAAISKAYANRGIFNDKTDFLRVCDELSENIFFYDTRKKPKPKELIDAFIYAHKRYGIKNFVIDNVMTMDVDRQDNSDQSEAANLVREFVDEYDVHVFLICHTRKSKEDGYVKPPHEGQIRGAAEWKDMAMNIICVWRNKEKEDNIKELEQSVMPQTNSIQQIKETTPDAKAIIRKQRFTGVLDMKNMWFKANTKRFTDSYSSNGSFIFPNQPHVQEEEDPF